MMNAAAVPVVGSWEGAVCMGKVGAAADCVGTYVFGYADIGYHCYCCSGVPS